MADFNFFFEKVLCIGFTNDSEANGFRLAILIGSTIRSNLAK